MSHIAVIFYFSIHNIKEMFYLLHLIMIPVTVKLKDTPFLHPCNFSARDVTLYGVIGHKQVQGA